MKAVIFARGYNITGQVEICRAYCEQQGYKIEGVIVGQGNDLPAIIGGLGTEIDLVVMRDITRLSRNALTNYTIQSELEIDYGVIIETATGRKEEATDRLMKNIIQAVQQEQRRDKERQAKVFELKLRGIIE